MITVLLRTSRDSVGRLTALTGPGMVDIQVNGYGGVDFCGDPALLSVANIRAACQAMRRRGVVMILATLTTDAVERMSVRLAKLAEAARQDELVNATIVGFHSEGPFINPEDGPRGAHPAAHAIKPADEPHLLEMFQEAGGGMLRYFSLAPELPGAIELIGKAVAMGIRVGLAHHAAPAEIQAAAVAAGAVISTHLGNGCHALLPRHDNYVQRQLADDRLAGGFIADGHHVPFPALKNFLRAKGAERSVLVTDAIAAADMPPGAYQLGRRAVKVGQDKAVRLEGTPYLAGSALTLDRAVLNVAQHCGLPLETAWAMASTQPAELMALPRPATVSVEVTADGFQVRS